MPVVLSVNVGMPKDVAWQGKTVFTGVYKDPVSDYGRLSSELFRAVRLVVDTGIHAKGWSRERALTWMREHTPLSEMETATEIDRYIAYPGQALSYELGYLKILELRAKAEKALGATFDIRHFHDTVLSTGSVPLPVLEQRIDRFIAEGGPEPDFGCHCAKKPATP